ncbi:MAG: bifunctional phosphoribosyl-AMP cyclohydrolase/phosphoribosyl-ATP diphosphatase HisIE [Sphingobacteriales bacterium]|nr:MAG: bifunctional phosphoribosyl-AMP cyclohydrolase/phosphoribosyl-ATP diphosphatase HisIE [Sphingobacteriales bacterium]
MNSDLIVDFKKYADGLVPCIVQDDRTGKVLMLGFMNEAALQQTQMLKQVIFFSRSKQRLWTKGESSGNFLNLVSIAADCDNDSLLIKAIPQGPVCHTGAATCFGEENKQHDILQTLETLINDRIEKPVAGSYINSLFANGINKIAQKVGEEAVELVIEAKDDNDHLFKEEAADLLFHYLLLLKSKNIGLDDVREVLEKRHK